ncbi:uncharacterized protein K02A2.6-like [Notechis scutatus]|uniref:Gypsy retrotransposon integrase-like protein 1 n=1 Tax=Notechis scutatus TaxID=8663 RepID=A0A6J1VYR0_9SAUR|nr:uncharacterized protein K02A2.6-like [Notechis scutatus]
MEVDTGSALSIISWETLKKMLPRISKKKLLNCHLTLRDYQGRTIPVLGKDPAPIHTIFEVNDLNLPITALDIAAHSSRDKGCLLWGTRVVIPAKLQGPVLKVLHEDHPGIIRMKALARSYIWWPGMDAQISSWVSTCQPCQATRPAPPSSTPTRWKDAGAPWSWLHIDLAGPVNRRTFLIIVDSFSKWIDLALLPSTTTLAITKALTRVFVTHGLPDTIVSDNGPQFTSCKFEVFAANLGIRHALTAPFHPASNGMAERAVRSVKEALERFGPIDWHSKLSRYLLTQHTTPCTTTNKSPADLLMSRRLRTTLDRLHPHYTPVTPLASDSQAREFTLQDLVYARNYSGHPLWVPGQVVAITGPKSYRVLLDDGRTWRRHIDQLRRCWRVAVDDPHCPPSKLVYPPSTETSPANELVYPLSAETFPPSEPIYPPRVETFPERAE